MANSEIDLVDFDEKAVLYRDKPRNDYMDPSKNHPGRWPVEKDYAMNIWQIALYNRW